MKQNQQTLRLVRVFGAWAWQKEEEWLNRMAHKGWLLSGMNFILYRFRRVAPGTNWVFQLDYNESTGEELTEYKQLFEDAGWDYVSNWGSWHYFRANADEAEVNPIHTNNESRIQMLQRLLRLLLIVGSPSFLWLMTIGPNFSRSNGWVSFSFFDGVVIFVSLGGLFVAYAALRLVLAIQRLRKEGTE